MGLILRRCVICKSYIPLSLHIKHNTCSQECRLENRRLYSAQRYREKFPLIHTHCKTCKKPLPKNRSVRRVYCKNPLCVRVGWQQDREDEWLNNKRTEYKRERVAYEKVVVMAGILQDALTDSNDWRRRAQLSLKGFNNGRVRLEEVQGGVRADQTTS